MGQAVCGDASCLSTADLPPEGEALPASVRQSSANLGKSILSQSVDIGNDLFTQIELSSSEVTWRIALERTLLSLLQRLVLATLSI